MAPHTVPGPSTAPSRLILTRRGNTALDGAIAQALAELSEELGTD
jgi:hypothetical protein